MSGAERLELTGFAGSSYVVTGGASGIGRAVTLLLASAGARVVAGDVDDAALAALKQVAGDRALDIVPIHLDVTDEAGVGTCVEVAAERGDLRGAVTAAGIYRTGPCST